MIRNQTNSIVIKPKISPAVLYSMIAAAVIVFIGSVAAAYYYGQWQIGAELQKVKKNLAEETRRYEALNEKHELIQDAFVQLKRQLHIDDSAYAELRKELEQSSAQLTELRSELKFYRSIISPQDGKQGVRVQEISIIPTEQPQNFKYKVVLIQTLQDGKELTGSVKFLIKGEIVGGQQIIQYPASGQKKLHVKFKYFQNLTGVMEFPAEFKPLEIKVELAGQGKESLLEENWYPWLKIMNGDTS